MSKEPKKMTAQMEKLSLDQPDSVCPIANTKKLPDFKVESECPFHKAKHQKFPTQPTKEMIFETDELLKSIGGGDKIQQMTTRFYAHCFDDQTLSKFMFENDCAAAHGKRLADWIIERMGGEGTPWADSGRTGLRQYSHYRAWNSKKRSMDDRGKRFKLDDCRIWMRLMFWSMREVGLDQHPSFVSWFSFVIERFIGIYERTSPPYTKKDLKWSEKQKNIDEYVSNGFLMKDVVGKGRR